MEMINVYKKTDARQDIITQFVQCLFSLTHLTVPFSKNGIVFWGKLLIAILIFNILLRNLICASRAAETHCF